MLSLSCLKAPTLSLCPGVQARPFLTAFGALCGKWATHPVMPSPAHSRHPHTLSQPHWGCALFPKHSASGFGHVGPLTQHASRMPLHLFKSRSFLGAPQFRRRFCQEAFQVSPGGETLPFLSPFRPFVRGSLLLFPFECAFWRTRAFFLTMSHFLLWVPVTQDKSIREAFPSPLGMTPVCRRQAVLPRSLAKCFSSPSLLLSRNYQLGG